MERRAGSARLLRALNETATLGHLLERGPLTRGDLRELTGLAKPTTSDVLRRLRDAGLATVVGHTSGRPGPNAEVYAVNPDAAYVAAISLRAKDFSLATAVCDLTGTIRARRETTVPAPAGDPVRAVAEAVAAACRQARLALRRLDHVQIGVPGSYDERAGVLRHIDVPGWSRPGLIEELGKRLRTRVGVDNDANLAAVAERGAGAAAGADGFALLWLGEEGLGLATDIGGTLLRGSRGGAGEIGYMPVGLPARDGGCDFHELVSGAAVRDLAARHGIIAATGQEAAALAAARGAAEFLDEFAVRIAVGLAAVIAVADPPLVVLSGEVGRAAGAPLAEAVTAALGRLSVLRTPVVATGVQDDAVLLGAVHAGLASVRATLLDRRPVNA